MAHPPQRPVLPWLFALAGWLLLLLYLPVRAATLLGLFGGCYGAGTGVADVVCVVGGAARLACLPWFLTAGVLLAVAWARGGRPTVWEWVLLILTALVVAFFLPVLFLTV